MCHDTRVVISTVGPYALYGEPLVEGLRRDRHRLLRPDRRGAVDPPHDRRPRGRRAQVGRAHRALLRLRLDTLGPRRLVPAAAGPRALRAALHRGEDARARPCAAASPAAPSASLLNVGQGSQHRTRHCARNSPTPTRSARRVTRPRSDSRTSGWPSSMRTSARGWRPFVMSAVNTRIVQRSNALSRQSYGADFRYDEAMLAGNGLKGRATAIGHHSRTRGIHGGERVAADALGAGSGSCCPAPGEGPSAEQQRNGFFDLRFLGKTADGRTLRVKVTGDRDPGYGSTAKMLGQAGACLALDLADVGPQGRLLDARDDVRRTTHRTARGTRRPHVRGRGRLNHAGSRPAQFHAVAASDALDVLGRIDVDDVASVVDVEPLHLVGVGVEPVARAEGILTLPDLPRGIVGQHDRVAALVTTARHQCTGAGRTLRKRLQHGAHVVRLEQRHVGQRDRHRNDSGTRREPAAQRRAATCQVVSVHHAADRQAGERRRHLFRAVTRARRPRRARRLRATPVRRAARAARRRVRSAAWAGHPCAAPRRPRARCTERRPGSRRVVRRSGAATAAVRGSACR